MSALKELLKRFSATGAQCVYCGREMPEGALACESCARQEEGLYAEDGRAGGILHVFRYDGIVRDLMHKLKYGDMPRYAFFIAQKMYEFLDGQRVDADIVTFVPVHKNRIKTRGFDQSELIAAHLSLLLGIPCEKLLERVRDTKPQFSLGREERANNMEGAFALVKEAGIKGTTILLIDDIYTTGATMGECVKLLSGEANAIPFTFCREY